MKVGEKPKASDAHPKKLFGDGKTIPNYAKGSSFRSFVASKVTGK